MELVELATHFCKPCVRQTQPKERMPEDEERAEEHEQNDSVPRVSGKDCSPSSRAAIVCDFGRTLRRGVGARVRVCVVNAEKKGDASAGRG